MALEDLLAEARKARLADDYDSAIKLCRTYLDVNPVSPEGESLLGLCEIETGRQGGAARIVKAAQAAPDSAPLAVNLSILREREGDIRSAVVHASNAARLDTASFEAWAQLGNALGKGEKFEEAFAALGEALRLRRDHSGVMLLYAAAALETGNLDACERALSELAALNAAPSEVRRLRAHLLRKQGNAPALQTHAETWLKVAPKDEEARIALAYALAERGYYDQAASIYAPLVADPAADAERLAAMGRYLLGARRLDKAAGWFKRALKADSKNAEASFGLARRSMFLGRMDDAQAWCRRTLDARPQHADAFGVLLEASGGRISDSDLEALDRALAGADPRGDDAVKLLFARGDAMHARKRADDAFGAWSKANRLKKSKALASGADYDRRAQEQRIDALIRLFPAERAAGPGAQSGGPAPIFIVGMPRSGTTLLESAICAHPDVDGAGEVPAMPFILDEFLDSAAARGAMSGSGALSDGAFRDEAVWQILYLDQCRRFGWKAARFVTDKQPSNFLSVGLIARLFPEARIIYIRRNPVETGFSIFRRNFTLQWPFTTDLEDIAHYYAEHCRIADHWVRAFPGRMAFVQYEDLVRNFESELRGILAYCGLSWNEACLSYHESERSVMTFSAAQVREPPSLLRLSSSGPYVDRLAPLIDALGAFGIDRETGARKTV